MSKLRVVSVGLSAMLLAAAACSASSDDGGDGATGGSSNTGAAGSGGDALGGGLNTGGGTGGSVCVLGTPDADGDGFTEAQGDCDDCDANSNPGAIEVPTNGGEPSDEDCDGEIDETTPPCDAGLTGQTNDPMDAARAIEMCKIADATSWGVLSAKYVRADGQDTPASRQIGIADSFGDNVNTQAGENMLVLSSGRARDGNDADNCGSLSCDGHGAGTAPSGFPQDVPNCAGDPDIYDDVALEVGLRAPTNATGLKFLFKFYSFEFPEWVCTSFNDQFIALVSPPPMGSINGNVSFDSATNPVSVNIAFFDTCDPAGCHPNNWAEWCKMQGGNCPAPPSPCCPAGTADLAGTGFDEWDQFAAATSWLQTTAPIERGSELTIRFAIWDTGDQKLDSTVMVDAFEWIAEPGVTVDTVDVPTPK